MDKYSRCLVTIRMKLHGFSEKKRLAAAARNSLRGISIWGIVGGLLFLWASLLYAQSFPSALNNHNSQKLSSSTPELIFCVFGDCRPAGDAKRLSITTNIARAMALEQPQFVIGTGDYIDGARSLIQGRRQWQAFFRALAPLRMPRPIPLALAVGNHDVGGGMGGLFVQYFGRRYFSFDVGSVHIIILDTEDGENSGRIAGAQWEWLNQDLAAAAQARLIFVALHRPLFPVGPHRGSSLDRYPPYRDRLHLLFARYKVSAVFCGHEHLYNHQERDGVHYFITGGGGAPLYASPSQGGFYHYLVVHCTLNSFTVQVKRLNL